LVPDELASGVDDRVHGETGLRTNDRLGSVLDELIGKGKDFDLCVDVSFGNSLANGFAEASALHVFFDRDDSAGLSGEIAYRVRVQRLDESSVDDRCINSLLG